jgi:hypothetical protein
LIPLSYLVTTLRRRSVHEREEGVGDFEPGFAGLEIPNLPSYTLRVAVQKRGLSSNPLFTMSAGVIISCSGVTDKVRGEREDEYW